MTERYLVSGVQLGMLVALPTQQERNKLVDDIINMQYINEHSSKVMDSCIAINDILAILRKHPNSVVAKTLRRIQELRK